MKTHSISAEKRSVTGKKVKHLRKQGIVPANIFGKTIKSVAISLNTLDFKKTYQEIGETGLLEVTIKGEKSPHHVLVNGVQINPVSDDILHVDLHEVALKEKIQVAVPITLTGEASAVEQKKGILLNLLDEVEVEALPTELPDEIIVDLSILAEVGDEIKVSDLKVDKKIKIITGQDEVIVRINPLQKEEAPVPVAEPAEGEIPTPVGEAPAESETAPAKPEEKKE